MRRKQTREIIFNFKLCNSGELQMVQYLKKMGLPMQYFRLSKLSYNHLTLIS